MPGTDASGRKTGNDTLYVVVSRFRGLPAADVLFFAFSRYIPALYAPEVQDLKLSLMVLFPVKSECFGFLSANSLSEGGCH